MRKAAARSAIGTISFTLAVAAVLILAASTARAALQMTVGNPGLEHFDSDAAVQLDFGLTSSNGQPAGNLTANDVEVFEDGQQAKILDFRGVGQGRPVDIVFVLDITESMQPYIDAVKQNIITFVRDLSANNRDYRLGLVTFEDYVVSAEADCNCEYRNSLTSDVNKFIGWVGTLHAGGGGDIPENQLGALAYAASLPFRPDAQGIVIIVTDAPSHHAGDDSQYTQHDEAYWRHRPACCGTGGSCAADAQCAVNALTGPGVAALMAKNGLTLYAVAPPPFIAPEYEQIVQATHGRLYNIVTEEGRFPELVKEIGHSISTEYSLTYRTPRPIEDGTDRQVQLRVNLNGENGVADTSYHVRGVGGAAINIPAGGTGENGSAPAQIAFSWWNGIVPLLAIGALLMLSRMRFGVSEEELKAIVAAQSEAPAPNLMASARQIITPRPRPANPPPSRPPTPTAAPPPPAAPLPAGEGRLTTLDPTDSIPGEYALLKDEISLGRGEDNDIVVPHASISRTHARLIRRNGAYEVLDLNSTNGSYVNGEPVQGRALVANGSEVRFGDIRFRLRF